MRILLLSDIHGRFDLVNRLAAVTKADAVIISGDLQLESHAHIDRLRTRELFLRIVHSPIKDRLGSIRRDDRDSLEAIVLEHRLLGLWDDVVSGTLPLEVPVYAVWGNHEDATIVRQADEGRIEIPNLTFLSGREDVLVDGWIRIGGIGGNLLLSDFLGRDVTTRGGKMTSTLNRYGMIFDRWNATDRSGEFRIFVQHVSPQKDRACANILMHLLPDLVVSGHMGFTYPHQFSLFGVLDPADNRVLPRGARAAAE